MHRIFNLTVINFILHTVFSAYRLDFWLTERTPTFRTPSGMSTKLIRILWDIWKSHSGLYARCGFWYFSLTQWFPVYKHLWSTKKIQPERFLVHIPWEPRISAFRGYLTFYFRFTGCRERCVQRRIAKPTFLRLLPRFSAKIFKNLVRVFSEIYCSLL